MNTCKCGIILTKNDQLSYISQKESSSLIVGIKHSSTLHGISLRTITIMPTFDPRFIVPVGKEEDRIRLLRDKIHEWIRSAELQKLLDLFEFDTDMPEDLDEALDLLEMFSNRWDFRRMARERGAATDDQLTNGTGAARWLTRPEDLPVSLTSGTMEVARDLGLTHTENPSDRHYHSILVLGGARLSCLHRTQRAAELVTDGLQVNKVALLGAARPVADSEREATNTYAPYAKDEFELMLAACRATFGIDPNGTISKHDDPDSVHSSWIIQRGALPSNGQSIEIVAVSAPSTEPQQRRANSADTMAFYLDSEEVSPGSSLLLITSQIYVPYVQIEAMRRLGIPRQLYVETIGFPGDRAPEIHGLSSPHHYLQEIRSAIQAARRFCSTYPT